MPNTTIPRNVIIFGASGLTGEHLLDRVLDDLDEHVLARCAEPLGDSGAEPVGEQPTDRRLARCGRTDECDPRLGRGPRPQRGRGAGQRLLGGHRPERSAAGIASR